MAIFDPDRPITEDEDSLIPYPVIDNRDEFTLAAEALARTVIESQGKLTDTTEHSPAAVLTQALSYCGAELLWYLNKLPRAIVAQYLNLAGGKRNLGTRAVIGLEMRLGLLTSKTIVIPSGSLILTNQRLADGSTLLFSTNEDAIFLPGTDRVEIDATCTVVGEVGNVKQSGTVFRLASPVAGISAIYALGDATGGTDIENLTAVENRILSQYRHREILVSTFDYFDYASEFLGDGSRVLVKPLLSGDKLGNQLGNVHIFGMNANGTNLTTPQRETLLNDFRSKSPVGTIVHVSNFDTVDVELRIYAVVDSRFSDQVNLIANDLISNLRKYFGEFNSDLKSIYPNDIEYVARNSYGVRLVTAATINNLGVALNLPNDWTLPKLTAVFLELQRGSDSSDVLQYAYGDGILD